MTRGDLDTRNINLRTGGDDVCLIETSERNSVNFVGSRDEEKARLELLQEDNSLSSESTREHDKHGSGSDGFTKLGRLGGEVSVQRLGYILSGVPFLFLLLLNFLLSTLSVVFPLRRHLSVLVRRELYFEAMLVCVDIVLMIFIVLLFMIFINSIEVSV